MSYKILGEIENPGYRREGNGRVLYVFIGEIDYLATEVLVGSVYKSQFQGEIDHSEYDPSIINIDEYLIEDCQQLNNIIGQNAYSRKISFFECLLENNILLVFVDVNSKTIEQIRSNKIKELIAKYDDLTVFAREYDHIYDY